VLAKQLIEILNKFPDYGVVMELPKIIADIDRAEVDCFDREEGFVFVLVPGEEV
jgi:hypothetical protein